MPTEASNIEQFLYTDEQANIRQILALLEDKQVLTLAKRLNMPVTTEVSYTLIRSLAQACVGVGINMSHEGVKNFQIEHKIAITSINKITAALYYKLMDEKIPQKLVNKTAINEATLRKLLNITGFFEGSGFSNIAGNFDGQGLSFGVLQWNFGQGTLQPMLLDMYAASKEKFKAVFGANTDTLLKVIQASRVEAMKFAVSINSPKNNIIEPWRTQFLNLGKEDVFQNIQVKYAQSVLDRAIMLMKDYALHTERALSLMFDIVTQNGSIKAETKQAILDAKKEQENTRGKPLSEREFLAIIATKRAEASNPKFVEDVKARKMAIVNGVGVVHGVNLTIDKTYGLTDQVVL